ncbi:MAG: hypothetical protein QXX08_07890 [Candidatus Bathyarchaeia archaeon]
MSSDQTLQQIAVDLICSLPDNIGNYRLRKIIRTGEPLEPLFAQKSNLKNSFSPIIDTLFETIRSFAPHVYIISAEYDENALLNVMYFYRVPSLCGRLDEFRRRIVDKFNHYDMTTPEPGFSFCFTILSDRQNMEQGLLLFFERRVLFFDYIEQVGMPFFCPKCQSEATIAEAFKCAECGGDAKTSTAFNFLQKITEEAERVREARKSRETWSAFWNEKYNMWKSVAKDGF